MATKSKSKMNKVVDIIRDMIKSNQDILKLLDNDAKDVDIYSLPNLSRLEASKVVNDKIITRPKVFSENEQCCYMVLMYGNKTYHEARNTWFNGNNFDVYILCHNDIRINDIVGDRVLEIEQLLEDMFKDAELDKVTCRTSIANSEPSVIDNGYTGRHITIRFYDMNR